MGIFGLFKGQKLWRIFLSGDFSIFGRWFWSEDPKIEEKWLSWIPQISFSFQLTILKGQWASLKKLWIAFKNEEFIRQVPILFLIEKNREA